MLVDEVGLLALELVELVEELEQLVVERSAAYHLLGVVYLDHDVAGFEHYGHHALVFHEYGGHAHGVYSAGKREFAVNDVTRVEVLHLIVYQYLQI